MRRFQIVCAGVVALIAAGAAIAPAAQALPIVGTVSVCLTINEKDLNISVDGSPVLVGSASQPPTCIVVP
jgi:hypothetical protein